jgi:serine protease Do
MSKVHIFLSQSLLFISLTLSGFVYSPQTLAQEKYTMKLGPPLPANVFSELAKKINPSVVSISVSINYRNRLPPGAYPDPIWQFFEQYGPPQPEPAPGTPGSPSDPKNFQPVGTGFIIESDGLILTNYHVIENADNVYVHLANNNEKTFEAKIIGGDKRTDIALLKIDTGKKLTAIDLGVSDDTQVGDWVAAFGNPYGHEFSMTKGIISAKGRKIRDLNTLPFIQTDASINPGNSGGPLVNIHGEVIGMNAAIDARGPGIGFAIPIDHIKSLLPELKAHGKVLRGFIGVQIDNISPRAQAILQIPTNRGALIMGVMDRGPADKAGIKAYDVITKFNGNPISSAEEFSDAVKDYPIGKRAKVELIRQNKKQTVNLLIDSPPDEKAALRTQRHPRPHKGDEAPFSVGFKVVDFSNSIARELGIAPKVPHGPIVIEVQSGSPAAKNGLKVGDVILDVNKKPVKNAKDVISALKKGNNLLRVQNKMQVSLIFLDL